MSGIRETPQEPEVVEAVARAIAHAEGDDFYELRAYFLKIARAAVSAFCAEAWRDIGTAPHGQEVLLGWWDEDGQGGSNWATEIGCASFGWRRGSISNMSRHSHASHWQPLPPPPERSGRNRADAHSNPPLPSKEQG